MQHHRIGLQRRVHVRNQSMLRWEDRERDQSMLRWPDHLRSYRRMLLCTAIPTLLCGHAGQLRLHFIRHTAHDADDAHDAHDAHDADIGFRLLELPTAQG